MQALLTSCVGSLRSFATSTRHQLKNKVPEHQKLFQADNDLPVHLKGGMVDGLLYRLTMTIAVFGTCCFLLRTPGFYPRPKAGSGV
uniref:Uncharacterized protein n=1 Tax=Chelonoidis abingdonii TaxID=106734 RepID=A0A8C0GP06_CHEAB